MSHQEVWEISLRSGEVREDENRGKSKHPVILKQVSLAQFNRTFLGLISDCDSSPVRVNSLNDLEEIVLLLCIAKV